MKFYYTFESFNNQFPSLEWLKNEYRDILQGDYAWDYNDDYIKDIWNIFDDLYNEKIITVYRIVNADEVSLDPYEIGESWTFEPDSIQYFSNNVSGKPDEWKVITAEISPKVVDWEMSMKLYLQFSSLFDSSENELFIPAGNDINVISIDTYKEFKQAHRLR